MKVFLVSGVKKSVLLKLTFIKFWTYITSDFLGLVNFGFLDLDNFVMVDRFSILSPTLSILPSVS